MNFTTTIQIPYNLAEILVRERYLVNKYETNQLIKALDTWLVLKHINTRAPYILDWNKQKKTLLKICKVSESIFRHRLKILSNLKLLKYANNITLCSWHELGKIFKIRIDRKYMLQYTTTDNKRIQEWIIATEVLSNQSRQRIAVVKKIGESPEYKKAIEDAFLTNGGNKDQIRNTEILLSWLKMQYINDFIQASPLHHIMVAIRPDQNRSVKGIKSAWKCKNICTVSYWKNLLQKAGIFQITKIQVESFDRVRNPECKVLWLKDAKQTLLCLCDQITVLEPWNRTNIFFE